jgi:hypothetical protein
MAKYEVPNVVSTLSTVVQEVEQESIIINIDGWRIRAYFDATLKQEKKEKYTEGSTVEIKYTGDLSDIHSVKLLKLK